MADLIGRIPEFSCAVQKTAPAHDEAEMGAGKSSTKDGLTQNVQVPWCSASLGTASSSRGADVCVPATCKVHVYTTDPVTAWLNWAGLEYAQVPIYHAGIEVYGTEWAFQYFDDAWDDETISGVMCCEPRHMAGFEYRQTINLGPSTRSVVEVRNIIEKMRLEWPANSYHLTRHNCLSFARDFVRALEVPEEFPSFLLGFSDAPRYLPRTDAIVDIGWNWYKWAVKRNSEPLPDTKDVLAETSSFSSRPACIAQGGLTGDAARLQNLKL